MPRKDYVPGAEPLLWIFVDQFCTFAITHQAVLNFSVGQAGELGTRQAAAVLAKENVYDQRALYEAAIEVKDETKASLVESLDSAELGAAFGREKAVHAVLAKGQLAEKLRVDAGRLKGMRS